MLSLSLLELLRRMDKGVLITPNVDHLMKVQRDKEFYQLYKQADWVVCDSNVVQLALRFLGKPVREVIPGSSLFPAYCAHHKENAAVRLFLLGAAPGVADLAAANINQKAGRAMVVAAHSPSYGFEKNEEECLALVDRVNRSGATVLVVGVGAPKQEKWIFKYKEQMPGVQLFMALGATLDFEAGTLQRAPQWMQQIGMEWFYRLIKEPRRLWKRYIVDDLPFFGLVLKEKMQGYTDPFAQKGIQG